MMSKFVLGLVLALAWLGPGSPGWTDPGEIAFALDADGSGGSRIYLARPDGSGARPVTPGSGLDRAPALSSDGRWLAYHSTDKIGVDRLFLIRTTGESKPIEAGMGSSPSWAAGRSELVFTRRHQNAPYIFWAKAADGRLTEARPLIPGRLARYSPDGASLAVLASAIAEGEDRWQIQVLESKSLKPRLRITLPSEIGQVVGVSWSPDGKQLLLSTVSRLRHGVSILSLEFPEPAAQFKDASFEPAYATWSADGKQILFWRVDASGARLARAAVGGGAVELLAASGGPSSRPFEIALSPVPPRVAQVPPVPTPRPAVPAPEPVRPVVVEPAAQPAAPAAVEVTWSDPIKLHGPKLFTIERERSPVSVQVAAPGEADFEITLQVTPAQQAVRRRGLGLTLEMADGSLYRGTVIESGPTWLTLQGRPPAGKVRLIDNHRLAEDGFQKGFKLLVRRRGERLILVINGSERVSRPLLHSAVSRVMLTLENFDAGSATFPVQVIELRLPRPDAPAPRAP